MTGRSPFDRATGFHSVRDSETEFSPPRKPNRRCCCLPVWLCFTVALLFLGGIALMLFFLWPRLPTMTYVSTSTQGSSGSKNIQYSENKLSFTLNSTLDLYNPNYVPLYLNNMTLRLSVATSKHDAVKIGDGYLPQGVSFPSHSNEQFNVLTNIILDVGSQDAANKEAVGTIVKSCTDKTKVPVVYYVKSDVPLVSWTGYQPSFSGQFDIDCPLT